MTEITRLTASRNKIRDYLDDDAKPDHMKSLLEAINHGAGLMIVRQNSGQFKVPSGKPIIMLVGDDCDFSFGPSAFHHETLRKFIAGCDRAAIVASEPIFEAYSTVAAEAAIRKRNVVIIETRPEHENGWLSFLLSAKPSINIILCSVVQKNA